MPHTLSSIFNSPAWPQGANHSLSQPHKYTAGTKKLSEASVTRYLVSSRQLPIMFTDRSSSPSPPSPPSPPVFQLAAAHHFRPWDLLVHRLFFDHLFFDHLYHQALSRTLLPPMPHSSSVLRASGPFLPFSFSFPLFPPSLLPQPIHLHHQGSQTFF